MSTADDRYLVAALLAVEGVADAVVEPAQDAQRPGVLRLRLVDGADEAAVSGEVDRMLRANFRLAVDADRVHVVREAVGARARPATALRAAPDAGPATVTDPAPASGDAEPSDVAQPLARSPGHQPVQPPETPRLSIERVQMVSKGLGVVATVGLGFHDRVFSGEAEGAATSSSIHRCVAMATVRAVESAIGGHARFEVDYVEMTPTGRDQTAVTVVTMVTGRGSERLTGASLVREDVRQAVIRSVLSAVNRRLNRLLDAP